MKFDAIQIHSTPEILAQQIVEQIKAEKLRLGQRLPSQRELAKAFNVGLGSVREALKILNVMGVVEILRGNGTFVTSDALSILNKAPTTEDALAAVSLADLMKARQIVEGGAARMAAEKADVEQIDRLRDLTTRMQALQPDSQAYYDHDFKFHIAVAKASGNRAILEIVKLLVDKAHYHVNFMNTALGISSPENMQKCVGSAARIVELIAGGDAEGAEKAMLKHLDTVNHRLVETFPGKPPNEDI